MEKLKYISLIFLLSVVHASAFSQTDGLSVKKFVDVSSEKLYARASDAPKDNSGNYPALLLIQVLSESEASFHANYMIGSAQKRGNEYWVYMADGAKYIEISLPRYEKIKVVFNDVSHGSIPALASKCTYELVINVPLEGGAVVQQAPRRQFYKMRVTPENAVVEVEIDGTWQLWTAEDGMASDVINYGTYRYRVSAPDYHTEEGTFTLDAEHAETTVTLRPHYGFLAITETANTVGAQIYATSMANNTPLRLGTVPLYPQKLPSGSYSIKLHKEKYKDTTFVVEIRDEETLTVSPTLERNSILIALQTTDFGTIYMDGVELGKEVWTGEVEFGSHLVEVRADKYQSTFTLIDVLRVDTVQHFRLNEPLPICGSVIVNGAPYGANVYVDDKLMGTTPLILDRLMVGNYSLRIDKNGYAPYMQSLRVDENNEQTVQYTLTSNTPVEQAEEDMERLAYEQRKNELLKQAEMAQRALEQRTREEAERIAMELRRKAREEALQRGEIERRDYVDLGLPSGTLWKKTNEGGDQARFAYAEAAIKYGNQLPTEAQQQELKDYCYWTLSGNQYLVTGPNGKSITLPADGYCDCNSQINFVGIGGYYWAFTREDKVNARYLFFDGNGARTGGKVGQCSRLSVRLVL